MNEIEITPLGKRNEEEQSRTALRLKRDARLDKEKRTRAKGHNTSVKWVGMKRLWSCQNEVMERKEQHTMPPEQKE